jgi:hypothetical protein
MKQPIVKILIIVASLTLPNSSFARDIVSLHCKHQVGTIVEAVDLAKASMGYSGSMTVLVQPEEGSAGTLFTQNYQNLRTTTNLKEWEILPPGYIQSFEIVDQTYPTSVKQGFFVYLAPHNSVWTVRTDNPNKFQSFIERRFSSAECRVEI